MHVWGGTQQKLEEGVSILVTVVSYHLLSSILIQISSEPISPKHATCRAMIRRRLKHEKIPVNKFTIRRDSGRKANAAEHIRCMSISTSMWPPDSFESKAAPSI